MVDLELMDALLDALRECAADPDRDATSSRDRRRPESSRPRGARRGPPRRRARDSYRMDTSDPAGRAVFELAQAVHSGDVTRLVDGKHARTAGHPRVPRCRVGRHHQGEAAARRHPPGHRGHLAPLRRAQGAGRRGARVPVHRRSLDPDHAPELEALWATLNRGRILTVTRALQTARSRSNAHLHELALDRLSVAGRPEFVPGEPVMITRTTTSAGCFNGDQGSSSVPTRPRPPPLPRRVPLRRRAAAFAIEALRDRLELVVGPHRPQEPGLRARRPFALVCRTITCRSSPASSCTPASRARGPAWVIAAPGRSSWPAASSPRSATPASPRASARRSRH